MKYKNIKHILIIPILIWMIVIFKFSNEPADKSQHTSLNITKKIVKIISTNEIFEDEKNELIEKMDKIVRKVAHYTLFLVGGIVIMIYISQFDIFDVRKMLYSIIIGIIYACTDEFHQVFIPGRSGKINDIWIDGIGVATGVCICLSIIKILNRFKKRNKTERDNNY